MKTIKDILTSPFKPLKATKYLGKQVHGTPYFNPRGFHPTIVSFRKLKLTPQEELDKLPNNWQKEAKKFQNLPMVRRCNDKIFNIFGVWFWVSWGWPIMYKEVELGWKDKWNTPRFEWGPAKMWFFFKWQYCRFYKPDIEDVNIDIYWEMFLWWKYYKEKDIKEAESTWAWINTKTKKSTWNNEYLK